MNKIYKIIKMNNIFNNKMEILNNNNINIIYICNKWRDNKINNNKINFKINNINRIINKCIIKMNNDLDNQLKNK